MKVVNEFENIIKNGSITTLFQPIVNLIDGETIGYEALSRGPRNSIFSSPIELLKIAEQQNKTWELELLFRIKAIEKAQSIDRSKLLFLNVDPNIIRDDKFKKGFTKEFLRKYNISPECVIFEITERTAIEDYKSFTKVLKHYVDQGYKIAVDDVGAGYSGLKTITQTKPHYIKIDMELIRDIDRDLFKQALIKSLVDLANTTNTKLIAEGIETEEELQCLIKLGVYAGQGYFLQKPADTFLDICENIKDIINKYNDRSNGFFDCRNSHNYIGDVMEETITFDISTSCEKIKEYFDNHSVEGVCIVKNNYPVGLMMKNNLNSMLAKQYGFAVYSKRPIELTMDKSPLIVEYYTPINKVLEVAMARDDDKVYDNIIVTKGYNYGGIVSIRELVKYSNTLEKNYARELNPLTGLPGNAIINRVLSDTVKYNNNNNSYIFYFDLDNFKIYNDIYGFENGDNIIKLTADIIKNNIKTLFPFNSFVGHIGGDDFVAVVEDSRDDCETLCKNIILEFDQKVLDFFCEKDINNVYIESEGRNGKKTVFNLTSISIAGLYKNLYNFKDADSLAQHMSIIKKKVKKIPHSSYIIEK
ncbi:GGDEF domain-containing protein [Tepidibacter aestuarii]|uniref:GGDEF domain-containing protein n=1 Tax=Tepidibacter aestuarii TaxID=2925782 RepID=UPI0020C0F917|nr:GGDEF domain-containing protein [Tepidibacter aestuarii]CAH2214507.1 EAL domain/GGDEF domain protein [Tepidibacter aestuarii]